MAKTIEEKRKQRALEAKRDALLVSKKKSEQGLALVRAELRHSRKK